MKSLGKMWQHGAMIAAAYGLGVLLAFLWIALPVAAVVLLLEVAGVQVNEALVRSAVLWSAPLWAPFGIGWAARRQSSEALAPEGSGTGRNIMKMNS